MEKFLQLESQSFLDYYDACTLEMRESLKIWFNKQVIEYLTFLIKDFESASKRLYGKVVTLDSAFNVNTVASIKLNIITEALNDGWTPRDGGYVPVFSLENNTFKFNTVKLINLNKLDKTNIMYGQPLLYRDLELAEYSGKQFISIWKDYYENLWNK
jgi:hypothetical protein